MTGQQDSRAIDVVIIGAGFSGMYALQRLRSEGLSVQVFDRADGVGGTWWWNRYPGARVDYPGGPYYSYTFSQEMVDEWDWRETQPDRDAVLRYLETFADKFDLRRDIALGVGVDAAEFDEEAGCWRIRTSDGAVTVAQFLISAAGTLSAPHRPDIPGIDDFAGRIIHTGDWPAGIDLNGARVGLIGTGSSGVQVLPQLARMAEHVTVFQRTPQFALPARNRALDPGFRRDSKARWPQIRREIRAFGRPAALRASTRSALEDTPEQREAVFEEAWARGGMALRETYRDLLTDAAANATVAEFVRRKIRETVTDPATAQRLLPDYYFGTKRQILDDGYYETFNRPNVELVDLREDPIERFTAEGVRTAHGEYPLDVLVLATGYDAINGAMRRLDPTGRADQSLAQKWSVGSRTYLGLMTAGFPNLFMVHGPETPSVMFHMPFGAETQGDWITACILAMRERGLRTIEPDRDAEVAWGAHVQELADATLYPQTASWFTGANIPGKPREFLVHVAGSLYYDRLEDVAGSGYEGFVFDAPREGDTPSRERQTDGAGALR